MFARKNKTPFKELAQEIKNPAVRKALGSDAFWHAVKHFKPMDSRQLRQSALAHGRRFLDQGRKSEAAESYYLVVAEAGSRRQDVAGVEFSMTAVVSILSNSFDLHMQTGNVEGAVRAGKLLSECKTDQSDDLEMYDKAARVLGGTLELLKGATTEGKDGTMEACRKKLGEFSAQRDTLFLAEVKRMILTEKITRLQDAETMLINGIDKETRLQEALKLVRGLWNSMHWLDP